MVVRDWENGKSECSTVMVGIEVASKDNIILTRKRAHVHEVLCHEKVCKPFKEICRMGAINIADAAPEEKLTGTLLMT